jgi:Flp pilus assembly protein TadG
LHWARSSRRSGSERASFASRLAGARGTALLETALTLPLLLLVSVAIFEFGRAYQTWEILTNAAREGARLAVLPNEDPATVKSRVVSYMQAGQLSNANQATVNINQGATMSMGAQTVSASIVTVNYPFQFMVLQPVAQLVVSGSSLGAPITITASAEMRNEAQ